MRKTKRKYPRSTACFAFIVRNSIRSYTLISDVYRITFKVLAKTAKHVFVQGYQIYFPMKKLLELLFYIHTGKETGTAHRNKHINIALLVLFPRATLPNSPNCSMPYLSANFSL